MLFMKNLFFLFIYLSTSFLFAQEVEVVNSSVLLKDKNNAEWSYALGQDETGFYFLNFTGHETLRKLHLEKYSPTLEPIYKNDIHVSAGGMGNFKSHNYTFLEQGKILLFSKIWKKKDKQCTFVVQALNEDGTVNEKETVLGKSPGKSQFKSPSFRVKFSPDGSKFVVFTQKMHVKKEKEKIRIQVFSTDDFSPIWEKDITLKNDSRKNRKNDITINNEGTAFIFKQFKPTKKGDYNYQLITVSSSSSTTESIDLKTYYPRNHEMLIDEKGNLQIYGVLAPKNAFEVVWNGLWSLHASPDGKVISNNVEPLDYDLKRNVATEKRAKNPKLLLPDYVLKKILPKPDGGALMIVEQSDRKSKLITTGGPGKPSVYDTTNEDNGVFVISYDKDGNRQWNTYLHKNQFAKSKTNTSNPFGSVASRLKDGKLYLVWNFMDPEDQANRTALRQAFGKKALYPTLLTVINEDGSFLYENRPLHSLPLVDICKENPNRMAIIPSLSINTPDGLLLLSRQAKIKTEEYRLSLIKF